MPRTRPVPPGPPRPRKPKPGAPAGASVRLNRFLSIAGVTSRRKADELIADGRVSVNGRVVTSLETRIRPESDSVFLNGKQVVDVDPRVYLLLNKPKDCITTLSDEKGRRSVLDVVKFSRRIFPVGRLDRNTTGALILTNDGDFSQLMMHPRNKVPKSYFVTTAAPVTPEHLRELAGGIVLSDGRTAPAEVEPVPGSKNCVVWITIREGRNRQIHRMFGALGYEVEKLDRIAYGSVSYEGLARGEWRHLTPSEVRAISALAGRPALSTPKNPEKQGKRGPGRTSAARTRPTIARGGTPPGSRRRARSGKRNPTGGGRRGGTRRV